jgi:hypothetical protein
MSFMYSGMPFGYNVITRRSCRFRNCAWSRFGSGLSVCDNGMFYLLYHEIIRDDVKSVLRVGFPINKGNLPI